MRLRPQFMLLWNKKDGVCIELINIIIVRVQKISIPTLRMVIRNSEGVGGLNNQILKGKYEA